MAVDDGYDPVTGYPKFKDSGAPDVGLDPMEVARYAAAVGNRIMGTTAYLNGYAYKREGLAGYDTTLGTPVVYRSGAWRREVSFRTFSLARSSMTDGTLFFQVVTEDTAKDTEPAFAYTYDGANGRVTPEAGIYLLHATGHPGGVVTGTTFLQILGSTQGVLARGTVAINADPWMTCSALFRANGTESFTVGIQKTTGGAASNGSGFLSVTKITTL
ncbi:hypothetical protein [Microbacterium hydrocarbonoxydans]|uniref:hypothetical protein n=1 Tax=Microbacterium hydrocarbonoxydans TaxID=273678 RepID=UPI003D959D2B